VKYRPSGNLNYVWVEIKSKKQTNAVAKWFAQQENHMYNLKVVGVSG